MIKNKKKTLNLETSQQERKASVATISNCSCYDTTEGCAESEKNIRHRNVSEKLTRLRLTVFSLHIKLFFFFYLKTKETPELVENVRLAHSVILGPVEPSVLYNYTDFILSSVVKTTTVVKPELGNKTAATSVHISTISPLRPVEIHIWLQSSCSLCSSVHRQLDASGAAEGVHGEDSY